jgi:hypothetical protein
MAGRSISHFDSPSIHISMDGSFVPPGYPGFTFSVDIYFLISDSYVKQKKSQNINKL